MQRLHERRRREPRERQRHRVVLGLVVDDVEVAGPLDRGGEVQQLVQLPRPHVAVVAVAVREDRVQRRPWCVESPVANSVTSWPRATSPSVSSDVIVSTEPELGGGIDVATGRDHARCAAAGS